MADNETMEPPRADNPMRRLDRVAECLLEARRLLLPLQGHTFEPLRRQTDLALMEVGRRIARELGTPDAAQAAATPCDEHADA